MDAATIKVDGDGWPVSESPSHPAGVIFSGGYDAETNTVYLASVLGHPRGVSLGGGDPSGSAISGLRVLRTRDGSIFWADDSMSLPRRLTRDERAVIQKGLEKQFAGSQVRQVEKLQDIPKIT